jgi:predicted PurR-regulated permease PerM
MSQGNHRHNAFLLLLAAVSVAFAWVVWPLFGAVFWGVVLAILFSPVQRRLLRAMHGRRNLAALATLLLCIVAVLIPVGLVIASLLREAVVLYDNLASRQIDFGSYFQTLVNALPDWALRLLDDLGIGNLADMHDRLSTVAVQASKFVATHALNIGQNTFDVVLAIGVMLYLLFFLFRDGDDLVRRIIGVIPLDPVHKRRLFGKFTTVIRATIKGNVVVAATQGALGGVMLWILGIPSALLWGVLMALLSLLPLVGAILVWAPIALYFLDTGEVLKGVGLITLGVLVIGLVVNVLRPELVGSDTRMPDYLVLISTLGGIALFGIVGFVIGPVIAALFIASWDLYATEE